MEHRPDKPCRRLALAGLGAAVAGALAHSFWPGEAPPWLAPALASGLGALALGFFFAYSRCRKLSRSIEACAEVLDGHAEESQKAKSEAEALSSRLSGILRAATQVAIIATDTEGRITVFNSGAEALLGYAAEEMVGRNTPEAFHLREEVDAYARELTESLGRPIAGFEAFVARAREGSHDTRQWTYVRKDGAQVPVELVVTAVRGRTGELRGFLGVALSLVERKRLERHLSQAQQALDNARDMVSWVDATTGLHRFVNKAMVDTLGYSREEFAHIAAWDLNPARTPAQWAEVVARLRINRHASYEARFRAKSGLLVPVEISASYIESPDGDYILGFLRDIRERTALLASLRQAQLSVDTAGDMIIWVDLDTGLYTYVNEAVARTLGYQADEIIGLHVTEMNPMRTRENWRELAEHLRAMGRINYETNLRHKDGTLVPVDITGSLVRHQGREHLMAMARDITEKKRLEASLLLAQVSVDSATDLICWVDLETRNIAYANKGALAAFERAADELIGQSSALINPGRTDEDWARLCETLREKKSVTYEANFARKSGARFPVDVRGTYLRHEGREYMVGIARDITEYRRLTADLKQIQVSVDAAENMIIWADVEDGTMRFVNQAVSRCLGYPREKLYTMSAALLNPGRTLDEWHKNVERMRAHGHETYELDYTCSDGSLVPLEATATLVTHEGREYAVGVLRDITERRKAQARLEREAKVNLALAEVARGLISQEESTGQMAWKLLARAQELTKSPHGLVGLIEPGGFLRIHAVTPMMGEAACGIEQSRDLFSPRPDGRYPGIWGHPLNTRQGLIENSPEKNPHRVGPPEGHVRLARVMLAPAMAQDRLFGLVAVANAETDYTEADLSALQALSDLFALGAHQSASREELRAARDRAEEASRAKNDFLANMTHEVRTPLNGVLGMLQVLESTSLDPDQAEYVRVALTSGAHLLDLLNNVLDYSRLEAGSSCSCETFPPGHLLQAAQAMFAARAKERGLGFTAELLPGAPELFQSDPQALRQCVEQLLQNALKFTEKGSVHLAIGPGPGGGLRLRVADTGIGIPPELRERVFETFFQADSSITRRFGGTGLGLAIVRKVAAMLGGGVEVAENPGGGTVMTLTVPEGCQCEIPKKSS